MNKIQVLMFNVKIFFYTKLKIINSLLTNKCEAEFKQPTLIKKKISNHYNF